MTNRRINHPSQINLVKGWLFGAAPTAATALTTADLRGCRARVSQDEIRRIFALDLYVASA